MGNNQPLGCRTDGAIYRCMGFVSATSGPDTELQVPDEVLQNFGRKMSFSKDVPKRPIVSGLFLMFFWCRCMAINNVNVQYNGGLLPDIILLEREANINWSMVICEGSTRSELP